MMASREKEGHSESTFGLPQVVQVIHTFPATDRSSHRKHATSLTQAPQDEAPELRSLLTAIILTRRLSANASAGGTVHRLSF